MSRRPKTWQDLIAIAELEPGDVTPVRFGTRDLAVYDAQVGIRVSLARCTHGAANLCDGYFDGRFIECPLHQGLFDVCDGAVKAAPARIPLRMVEARVVDGMVQVLL
ncbi:MAG: Rieske 2Fe-2S domain-containing protein [Pseudomonadota bacterium]